MRSRSISATLCRINRLLKPFREQIKTCRFDSRAFRELGRHYVLDWDRNWILATHVDPEEYERELRG